MIYLNIMSYSVLSGCGTCSISKDEDLVELEDILKEIPINQKPYNISFAHSLYKKSMPHYEQEIDDPYDFSSFKWTSKKQKKEIKLEVMANSIIACCNLAERILTCELEVENPSFAVYILHKTASKQAQFINKHLKVGSLFYNGEDASEQNNSNHLVQISSDTPDKTSQFAVLHAFSALYRLNSYQLHYLNCDSSQTDEDINMLPTMLNNMMANLEQSSTKELSLVGLHLTEIYKSTSFYTEEIEKLLKKLGRELYHRISDPGILLRKRESEEAASPNTTCNCLNLLSQLAFMFRSKSCYESSHKLYAQLTLSWDKEGSVFKMKDSNKQNYNIKTIASIISALHSFSKIVHDANQRKNLQKQTIDFFNAMFIQSGVFNGQCYPILQNNKIEPLAALDFEKPWAPVFNKGFEFKISKKKYYCDADVFRADQVLPACVIMLNSINI